ncbi:MAG: hypothetical protein HY820_31035 [Acidobacteria bacterium]|nr:hypothetical protein [Acidobacteriota bacterium]
MNFRLGSMLMAILASPAFPQNSQDRYLALGDSVSFGLDPTLLLNSPPPKASDFAGYPEIVRANSKKIAESVNASCPGETSASFLDPNALNNGCTHPNVAFPDLDPFKDWIGLHVEYPLSQMEFAVSHLLDNRNTKLVTLSIGANDLILLQYQCAFDPACMNDRVNGVLNEYADNLSRILAAIRIQGRFNGTLVLVKYYSPTSDPLSIQLISALNATMEQVGNVFEAEFADGFTAFQKASESFGGNPCKAHLLVPLSLDLSVCDVHPSRIGQAVLAATVLEAFGKK